MIPMTRSGVEGVRHDCTFSLELWPHLRAAMEKRPRVLDPFAGVGTIHDLAPEGTETLGIEIEPEWAACHPQTICGDTQRILPRLLRGERPGWEHGGAVVTSPCYGNREADYFDAKDGSRRHGYGFSLGRRPSAASAANMTFGPEYCRFHYPVILRIRDWVEPGGIFVLNMKDHPVRKKRVRVCDWWIGVTIMCDFELVDTVEIDTRGAPGANRSEYPECLFTFRRAE
jgi:hypothetical protein